MRSYGQFCPIAKAASLFCERWTALLIRDLGAGAHRFSELQRGVPLMSPTLLSKRLRQMEAEGVVERRPAARGSSYHLTQAGLELVPLVDALGVWGQRWSDRDLADEELDAGLLVFQMQRRVQPEAFGARRSVVHVHLTDQPECRASVWFIHEAGVNEVCTKGTGVVADVVLASSLADLIRVWRGDLALQAGLDQRRMQVTGTASFVRALPAWLSLDPHSQIPSARPCTGSHSD